jgi:hypothetical protein
MNKQKITQQDKDEIASKIIDLIRSINKMVYSREIDTFDLRDIRVLVKKKIDHWELNDFNNCFTQIWKVWPDD